MPFVTKEASQITITDWIERNNSFHYHETFGFQRPYFVPIPAAPPSLIHDLRKL